MNVLNSAPKTNDVPLEPGPSDSVTRIEFNPVVDYLAVGSWDNQVSRRCPQGHRRLTTGTLSKWNVRLTLCVPSGTGIRGQRYHRSDYAKGSGPARRPSFELVLVQGESSIIRSADRHPWSSWQSSSYCTLGLELTTSIPTARSRMEPNFSPAQPTRRPRSLMWLPERPRRLRSRLMTDPSAA